MNKKFSLIYTGGHYGDETCSYNGYLDQPLTVREFVDAILEYEPDEWGRVCIFNHVDTQYIEYSEGEINFISSQFDGCLNKKIKTFTAHGGWSRMDYNLVLEDE